MAVFKTLGIGRQIVENQGNQPDTTREQREQCENAQPAVTLQVTQEMARKIEVFRSAMVEVAATTPGVHLYVVQNADGAVKIGRTNNIEKRLAWLSTGSAVPLKFVHVVQHGAYLEYGLHELLSEHRLSGEWFSLTPESAAVLVELFGALTFPFGVQEARAPRGGYTDGLRDAAALIADVHEHAHLFGADTRRLLNNLQKRLIQDADKLDAITIERSAA